MDFLPIATQLGTAIVSVPVILWLSKQFFQKQIDHLYSKNFETWKHKVDIEYDKALRINQKEIELLPEVWNKAMKVRDILLRVCLNRTVVTADLNKYDEFSYRSFVDTFNFPEFTRIFLLNAVDRNSAYLSVIADDGINVASRSYEDYQDIMDSSRIFLTKKLTEQLQDLKAFYFDSIEKVILLKDYDQKFRDAFFNDVQNGCTTRLSVISDIIKDRIRFVE